MRGCCRVLRSLHAVNIAHSYGTLSHARSLTARSQATVTDNSSVARKRVLGIAAHIDCGKTTTSEAILYNAGALRRRRRGRVDAGDTVMDYLPIERERGITVSSASITFDWNGHKIFLVDSPGHLDFTFELK